MTEDNPILSMLLHANHFVGPGAEVDENMEPLPSQYAMGIGDKALLANANTPLEEDFTLLEIIDPEPHAGIYPDWEERWGMNRHVLAQYFSFDDPEGGVGWFPRVKLLPLSEERYAEALVWKTEGFPIAAPDWVEEMFTAYTDQISSQDPGLIPVLVTCGNCGSRNVHLHVQAMRRWDGRAGQVIKDGEIRYIPVNEPDVETDWSGHLKCMDCKAAGELDNDDWDLPPQHR